MWKVDKTAEGRYARRTDQASGNSSIYFDIDGDYVFGGNNVATVTVTYYDQGTDRWELHYDSSAGVDKLGGTVRKGNTLTWRKAVFLLRDAQFADRMPGGGTHPGSDLRIWSADDGNETIQFVDVEVRPSATKTLTLQPGVEDYDGVRDTYISQWDTTSNFGGARSFWVGSRDVMAGLLRFDLAQLPASARIVTATLQVYQYNRDGSAPLTLAAHRMLRPWDEFAATWQMAAAATSWQQPGASGLQDRDVLPSGTTMIDQSAGWASIDITHIVQQWVTVLPGNEGLLLRGSSDGSVVYRFAASNYAVREQRPRLVIEYTDATPRATRTPTPTRDIDAGEHADTDGHPDAHKHGDIHDYADADWDVGSACHRHSDGDRQPDGHAYRRPDGDAHAHGNTFPDGDSRNGDRHRHGDGDSDLDIHPDRDGNPDAFTYAYSYRHADAIRQDSWRRMAGPGSRRPARPEGAGGCLHPDGASPQQRHCLAARPGRGLPPYRHRSLGRVRVCWSARGRLCVDPA